MIERFFGPEFRRYMPGACLVLVQFSLIGLALLSETGGLIWFGLLIMALLVGILAIAVVVGTMRRDRYRCSHG